ncbi:kinase-like domain-containing protein [Gigaspora rosea]|uniref:non-specific serine/threonine protein kinase n=1 Tax=Gigaspora rosea TaxID=44941 RepID=A0A397V0U9_9GLOM|nr:kinase-like domain-containing protein [Gigaspora rosea]
MASNSHDARELPATSVGDYIVGSEIGRGSFATVYKGFHKKNKNLVAIKSVLRSKLTKKLLENLESEIKILKGIRHDHIVQLVDCQKVDTHIHLIMEYCSMGDLSNFIKRRGDPSSSTNTSSSKSSTNNGLSEYVVRHFLKQLANALEFLRSQNLIHRDIKPQNLLLLPPPADSQTKPFVGSPDLPILKIADFGFARFLPQTSMADTLCGSPLYMAPEILRYEKYDAKADLWSVGAVLYEMSIGKPPFRATNHVELLKRIEKGGDRIRFPGDPPIMIHVDADQIDSDKLSLNNKAVSSHNTVVSEELKDLIRHLLKRNPVERISFEEFFMHPCVAGELVKPNLLPQTSLSKEKLIQDIPKNSTQDYDNIKRHARDRSISSPVPLTIKDEVGIDYSNRAPQSHTKNNLSRKDFEASSKGITNTLSGEYSNSLQKKTSRDSVKNQQINYRTTTKFTSNIPGIVHPPLEKFERLSDISKNSDNDNLQIQTDLHPYYENSSPTPSLLVQQPYGQEDTSKNIDGHSQRLSNPEEDVLFEREYVVVESRRCVEVNKLADELAASPKSAGLIQRLPNKNAAIVYTGPNPLELQYRTPNMNNTSGSFFYSTTPPFALPLAGHERASSGNFGSGQSALAKALSVASTRLFGTGNSPPSWSDKYSKHKGNMITFPNDVAIDPEEESVVKKIEDYARKAHVVYQFANTKLDQLLPPLPTASSELMNGHAVSTESAAGIAHEACVLYLKSLSLLQSAMDSAGEYWTRINEKQSNKPDGKGASPRFNQAVQWVRKRFNECLEKAEYIKSRYLSEEETNVNGCFVEKLLYDRALEMSRQAAINELTRDDLPGCERAYKAAIYMLNAILENPMEDGDTIDEEDRLTVNNFISSINNRLNSLQKKLAQMDVVPVL